MAVAFSLDVDNQTAVLSSSQDTSTITPLDMSIAEYGAATRHSAADENFRQKQRSGVGVSF